MAELIVKSVLGKVHRSEMDQISFARAFLREVLNAYWKERAKKHLVSWEIRPLIENIKLIDLSKEDLVQAIEKGRFLSTRSEIEAGFQIGSLYSGLLPPSFRSRFGVYYTPPCLTYRLLDLAVDVGIDWGRHKILDPACGGGAFLAPVASKMKEFLSEKSPDDVLEVITKNLRGFEIDPFSAWISEVLTETTLLDICAKSGKRLPNIVEIKDTLNSPATPNYDLVIGNPPYGKISLSEEARRRFKGTLYGHANLYALFTDVALQYLKPGGVLAFVTPTSFLAGQYFKNLRKLLHYLAPPVSIDFISSRNGVFDTVLQETLLAVFLKGKKERETVEINLIDVIASEALKAQKIGQIPAPRHPSAPWMIPRSKTQAQILNQLNSGFCTLADYGYKVSTGPLVWNRHKEGFRPHFSNGCYPVIWAESISNAGAFRFKADKANHQPFFEPSRNENWLIRNAPCILIQRTTSKEQESRIIAAILPDEFIDQYSGVIVENHINMVIPSNGAPVVRMDTLLAIFSSRTIDEIFRCISGSVAVSAYELESIPLPPPHTLGELENLIRTNAPIDEIEQEIINLYAQHSVPNKRQRNTAKA